MTVTIEELLQRVIEQAKRIALHSIPVNKTQMRSDIMISVKNSLMLLGIGCMRIAQKQKENCEIGIQLVTKKVEETYNELNQKIQLLAGDTETVAETVIEVLDGSLPEMAPSLWDQVGIVTLYYNYDHITGNKAFTLPSSVPLGKRLAIHNTAYDVRLQVANQPNVVVDNGCLPINGGLPDSWRVPRYKGTDSGSVVILRSSGLIDNHWVWRVESAFLTE